MILQSIKATIKTSDGSEILLHKGQSGAYSAKGACADVTYIPFEGGYVLYADADLKDPAQNFDVEAALTLRFTTKSAPYMAYCMKTDAFWCRPAFGEDFTTVPDRTQALLFKEGNRWRVLWSLCGDVFNCTLHGGAEGLEARIASYSDGEHKLGKTPVLLYFTGKDPHTVIKKAAKAAEKLLNGRVMTVDKKEYPAIFEYLGWCSWDALQIRVNEAGLLEKAAEFKEKNIPVRWCIIDDMWGHVKGLNEVPADIEFRPMVKIMHQSKLYAMEADPKRFPNGLGGAIQKLHDAGLTVGVWYPTTGYWKGVDPDGPIVKELAEDLVALPNDNIVVKPTYKSACRFHTAMQDMLKAAGTDFVKIDNQTHYRNKYRPYYPVGVAAKAIQDAIEDVTEAHFGNALINCMGMGNESMWNRRKSGISRCSGDFMPENRAWFAKHIQQCAYNSLFQGQFHFSDWDMWWTDDEQAKKNSICRAISGGPIYVSDKIGRSRPEVLKPLCFDDGRILRPDVLATPIQKCLLNDPTTAEHPLFIHGKANGCGLLAAFNIHAENKPQQGTVTAAEAGLVNGRYLVREQLTGAVQILEKGEALTVALADNDEFRLYIFYPLRTAVTPLGRIDKFISPKAILRKSAKGVKLYEGGQVAFLGVSAISTDKRDRVEGVKQGSITVFELAPDETEITYLS
ncbi:MAG: hypothetical protein IJX39_05650 [Clostridia bacterium]|nr:hypothetical protein [Clostridia bacterium]